MGGVEPIPCAADCAPNGTTELRHRITSESAIEAGLRRHFDRSSQERAGASVRSLAPDGWSIGLYASEWGERVRIRGGSGPFGPGDAAGVEQHA